MFNFRCNFMATTEPMKFANEKKKKKKKKKSKESKKLTNAAGSYQSKISLI